MTSLAVNLLWITPGAVGGSEEYALRTTQAFLESDQASDFEVTLHCRASLLAAHPHLAELCRVDTLALAGGHRVARAVAESSWLAWRTRPAELIHHVGGRVPAVRPGRGGHGPRRLVTLHDLQPYEMPENFSPVKRRYLTWAIPRSVRRCRVVIAPSEYVAASLRERFRLPAERVVAVSSGFDPAEVRPATALAGEVASIVEGQRPFVVYPAMTHPHKDHETLLRALRRLLDDGVEATVVLTGAKGRADGDVAAAIERLGLDRHVVRLGRVDRSVLDRLLVEAVALAFPSTHEGFGIPVLEAMTAGCPVVACRVGALAEVVGDAGVLFDPGDDAALARTLAELIASPRRRAALVEAGTRRARTFSWERSGAQLAAAYRRALAVS